MFRRFGIGTKLMLAFAALAGVTVVVVIAGFLAGGRITQGITLAEVRLPASLTSTQARANLLRMQLHLRGYLVLGDVQDIEQFQAHEREFEKNLSALQSLSRSWSREDAAKVAQLTSAYESWVKLPQTLFDLHDNPLKNRPALRLARMEVQPRKVEVLSLLEQVIDIQKDREPTASNRVLLADLVGFQASFDAMVTNLMAYASSGELNFKLAYGPQLSTNAALWQDLSSGRAGLTGEQREHFDTIARRRAEISELALQIVGTVTGDRAYHDLYLFRTEAQPQAQHMLSLLEDLTARQQAGLQSDLGSARDRLSAARVGAIVAGLVAILLAVALAFVFHWYIVGPVRRLAKTAELVAAGDWSARPSAMESKDEIGRLAETINTRLRKEELQQLMASVSDALWSAEIAPGGAFTYRYYSPVVERIAGLPPQHFLESPQRWLDVVHPQDRAELAACLERISSGASEREDAEYRILQPHGAERWVRDSMRATRQDDGRIIVNGVVSDVTDRKHTEEELRARQEMRLQAEQEMRRLEQQLRQAQRLEAMGTLAGGIAHDFNNILGAILGYGEMALRDAPSGSRLRRDVDSIMAAGERGRALVDRILAFSRSGVGERIAVHVEEVVGEALELIEAKAPEGVKIEARLEAGRAAMLGDPTQVHQVLMNLATNALQAMGPEGTLTVSLRVVRLAAAHVATTGTIGDGEYIVLAVADTGCGMGREVMERIFDPFFTTKEVGVGTGLGLSLVHGIVTELGGGVDVESTAGVGSVFTVYLPRTGDALEGRQGEMPDVPLGNRQRILLVDDEVPLVRLATENLADLGYSPIAFTSSKEALEAFRAHPERFDAVIADERMPGLAGSALIGEIHAIRPEIPKLLVSGFVSSDLAVRAREAGVTEVLRKPLALRELALSLARALRAAGNAAAQRSALDLDR